MAVGVGAGEGWGRAGGRQAKEAEEAGDAWALSPCRSSPRGGKAAAAERTASGERERGVGRCASRLPCAVVRPAAAAVWRGEGGGGACRRG